MCEPCLGERVWGSPRQSPPDLRPWREGQGPRLFQSVPRLTADVASMLGPGVEQPQASLMPASEH